MDKETKERMDQIEMHATSLGLDREFQSLPMPALVFLNEQIDKRRLDEDWIKYFLIGYRFGKKGIVPNFQNIND